MNTRLVGLFGLAALLAAYVGYQQLGLFSGDAGTGAVPGVAVPARSGAVKLNPLAGLDPAALNAIVARPLFNPDRKPRPAEAEAPPPAPPPDAPAVEDTPPPAAEAPGPEDYKLLGVSAGPDGRIAALRVAASGDVVYLRQGESIDNWTLLDIADRSVSIGTPAAPVTYKLFDNPDAAGDGADGQAPDGGGAEGSSTDGQAPDGAAGGQPPLPLPVPQPAPAASVPPDTGG